MSSFMFDISNDKYTDQLFLIFQETLENDNLDFHLI